jgi:hypothetical protein
MDGDGDDEGISKSSDKYSTSSKLSSSVYGLVWGKVKFSLKRLLAGKLVISYTRHLSEIELSL